MRRWDFVGSLGGAMTSVTADQRRSHRSAHADEVIE
jgi:hypothetical protein